MGQRPERGGGGKRGEMSTSRQNMHFHTNGGGRYDEAAQRGRTRGFIVRCSWDGEVLEAACWVHAASVLLLFVVRGMGICWRRHVGYKSPQCRFRGCSGNEEVLEAACWVHAASVTSSVVRRMGRCWRRRVGYTPPPCHHRSRDGEVLEAGGQ